MIHRKQQCPCCGYMTLDERGRYDICAVCFWEDDCAAEQFDQPASERPRGPNGVHLWQARLNYRAFGAAEENCIDSVRHPRSEELPDPH